MADRKLLPCNVRHIRQSLNDGQSVRSLARLYGVDRRVIREIRDGRRYRWVTEHLQMSDS